MTVVNKLDRQARDASDLLDEIEQSLALDVTPASWPIGMGHNFLGTYDLFADALLSLERGVHDSTTGRPSAVTASMTANCARRPRLHDRASERCNGLDDRQLPRLLPEAAHPTTREGEMAKGLCPPPTRI